MASYADDEARVLTRATRSHNVVEVDRRDSCEVWGAFRLGRRGRGEVLRAEVVGDAAVAELAHDGYAWMRGGPRVRRTWTLTSGRLDVRDRVEGGSLPFVSRLRLDEDAARGVRVTRDGAPIVGRSDVWYARHGEPRGALVFEAAATGSDAISLAVEW